MPTPEDNNYDPDYEREELTEVPQLLVRMTTGRMVVDQSIFLREGEPVIFDVDKIRNNVAELIAGIDTDKVIIIYKDNTYRLYERVDGW